MTPTWTDYLDAVEAAALDVQTCLLEGRTPQMPVLTLPAGPPPAGAEVRRDQIAGLLAQVTELVGRQRDEVGAKLATLPRQRPRSAAYHSVSSGARVDVLS
jgi:hypothetical protein